MKAYILSGSIVILLSLFIGCSDSPSGPSQGSVSNLLPNGSFERFGQATLEGWQATSEDSANLTQDAPPLGGSWSLFRESDWIPVILPGFLSDPLGGFQDGDIVRLSAYVRAIGQDGIGMISLMVGHGSNRSMSKYATASESDWTFIRFDDTLSVAEGDSIWVGLDALPVEPPVEPTGALFDLISLERVNE